MPVSSSVADVEATRMREEHKQRDLRRMKLVALSFLLGAAVLFVLASLAQSAGWSGWVGFLRAAAEAGMVGGLADWFAVTAIFRYPLGLKIPHTAIVKRKKDQVGEALSDFVAENFLNATLITQKIQSANLPSHIANWLVQPANADRVSKEVGKFTARVVRALDPDDAEAVIRTAVVDKLKEPAWGPPVGKLLEDLIKGGQVEPVVDQLVHWLHVKALG